MIEEQHAGLGVVIGGAHDLVPQVARAQLAVDPEPAAVGLRHGIRSGGFLCFAGRDLVHQFHQAVGLHGLHEGIGHADRDVEVLQVAVVLGVDEFFDVWMVTAQHRHLRAAPRSGRFHRLAGAVEYVHITHRPGGVALGASHPCAARANA